MIEALFDLKQAVFSQLKDELDEKINTLSSEFRLYQESAANETKSTAGDKHDTSKSMMQLEQEKLGTQLQNLQILKKNLSRIDSKQRASLVGMGTMLETNHGKFFLGIPWQQIVIGNERIFIVSVQSPIGQQMIGKKPGDQFSFSGKDYQILSLS